MIQLARGIGALATGTCGGVTVLSGCDGLRLVVLQVRLAAALAASVVTHILFFVFNWFSSRIPHVRKASPLAPRTCQVQPPQ